MHSFVAVSSWAIRRAVTVLAPLKTYAFVLPGEFFR